MKIFAKRKRSAKADDAGEGAKAVAAAESKATFASDALVQELLKNKDPSEWNAKEKRMVKRYQKRIAESGEGDEITWERNDVTKKSTEVPEATDKDDTNDDNHDNRKSKDDNSQDQGDDKEVKIKDQPIKESSKESKVDVNSPSKTPVELESVLEESVFEALNSKQRRKLSRSLSQHGESAVKDIVEEANQLVKGEGDPSASKNSADTKNNDNTATGIGNDEGDEMEQVKKLLQGLNSKQKRKLSRRLEREGTSCLEEVKTEAEELLKAPSEEEKAKADEANTKKRKRRRGPADLSGLTPEERVRREEQRKVQKEAAELRASGEDPSAGFKHPLNSERRRANKRKPKWAPRRTFANPDKVEHNSSGFHVRKMRKTEA